MGKIKKIPLYLQERGDTNAQKNQYEQTLQRALTTQKKVQKSFVQLVEGIYNGQITDRRKLDAGHLLFDLFEKIRKKPGAAIAFRHLLLYLEKQHCYRLLEEKQYLTGLCHIASSHRYFLREVNTWKKPSHNPARQFSDLLRHCFAQYRVPSFMDQAWLGGKEKEQCWFIDIGNGYSVRQLRNLPIMMTKRMANEFLQAPDYCNTREAFRWAQVMAMGGDANLAYYVNRSLLGRNNFRDDAFWVTVIQFFARLEMFDNSHVEAIVDYINHQRFVQDNFSMKGRTVEALLRQTEAWHAELNRERIRNQVLPVRENSLPIHTLKWLGSGIRGYGFEEGKNERKKLYTLRELLSGPELGEEGKAMQHCVASYTHSCYTGKCSIFSLSVHVPAMSETQKLATIEVNLRNQQVVQIKRKYNAAPLPKEMEIIREWVSRENLTFSKWL
jgi:hypothetical protein